MDQLEPVLGMKWFLILTPSSGLWSFGRHDITLLTSRSNVFVRHSKARNSGSACTAN